jgi:PAS domain S-box-containing protein
MAHSEKTTNKIWKFKEVGFDSGDIDLFDQLPAAAYLLQADRFVAFNQATVDLLGHTAERLSATNYWEICEASRQADVRKRGRAWLQGQPMEAHGVCPIVNDKGERKWIEVFRRRIEFRGAPALLVTAVDLTERWAWLDSAKRLIGSHGDLPGGNAESALPKDQGPHAATIAALTRRQRQVLDLIAQGRSNKQIARNLGITEGTVKLHVFTLMRSFQVANRTLLALIAHEPRFDMTA